MTNLLSQDVEAIIGSADEYDGIVVARRKSFLDLAGEAGSTMGERILQSVEILDRTHEAAKNLPEIRRIYTETRPVDWSAYSDAAAKNLFDTWSEGGVLDADSVSGMEKTKTILSRYNHSEDGDIQVWISDQVSDFDDIEQVRIKRYAVLLLSSVSVLQSRYAIADDLMELSILLEGLLYKGVISGYNKERVKNSLRDLMKKMVRAGIQAEFLEALELMLDSMANLKDLDETKSFARNSKDLDAVLDGFDAQLGAWSSATTILMELINTANALPRS